jgi:ubiquinol-cytochrome c reductase iron-sulfur subunit
MAHLAAANIGYAHSGSMYDSSGRICKGPAPLNIAAPPYAFTTNATIKIG